MDSFLEKLSMKYYPSPYYMDNVHEIFPLSINMDNVHEIWTIEKKHFLTMYNRRPWTIVHETSKTQFFEK